MSYTSLAAIPLLRYLERIGFTGKAQPDLATLQSLHLLHPCAITFENLDSWCGITPSLDEEAVFNKLVMQQRGGYCFEHNQLFLRVLQTIRLFQLNQPLRWVCCMVCLVLFITNSQLPIT